MRQVNDAGLELIKSFEGCKLKAYKDVRGILTIGYGHTGADVEPDMEINQAAADSFLKKDIEWASSQVEKALKTPVSDNEFAALVCFAFNVGVHACISSTLMKLLNAGKHDKAAEQFVRWDMSGGKVVTGLHRRRLAERELFLKA